MAELRFTFDSKNQEREDFFAQLRRFAAEGRWLPGIANEVELIFEEWLTNVLSYGLKEQPGPEITITLQIEDNRARIEVKDNGIAFDPTTRPDPDINVPAEERPIGGLGIFMIKKLCSGMRYERRGEWNSLVLEKDLTKPVLSPRN